jgi:hypothetical protein
MAPWQPWQKFTAIRVVCNNTITAAVGGYSNGAPIRGEADSDKGYLKSAVRVLHSANFDPDSVRLQLGIVANQFERFMVTSRQLAGETMSAAEADDFVAELLKPYHTSRLDISESKAYKRIMQLFNGAAIGSDIQGVAGTRWAAFRGACRLVRETWRTVRAPCCMVRGTGTVPRGSRQPGRLPGGWINWGFYGALLFLLLDSDEERGAYILA